MRKKDPIKDWTGRIIGWIEVDEYGNKTIRDFYNKVLSTYNKRLNITRDFYGRQVAKGDNLLLLLKI
jgi:hypothetical protein